MQVQVPPRAVELTCLGKHQVTDSDSTLLWALPLGYDAADVADDREPAVSERQQPRPCEDADPLFNWAVKIAVDSKIALLDPNGKDPPTTALRFRRGYGRGPGGHARHTSAR